LVCSVLSSTNRQGSDDNRVSLLASTPTTVVPTYTSIPRPTSTKIPTSTPTPTPRLTKTPTPTATPTPWGHIAVNSSPLRAGPDTGYSIVVRLPDEQPVTFLAQDETGEWLLVEAASGTGWISRNMISSHSNLTELPVETQVSPTPTNSPTPTATPPVNGVVKNETVNLRRGPGTNYDIAGKVSQDDRFVVDGKTQDGDWLRVKMLSGVENDRWGWLFADLLDLNAPVSHVAEVSKIPPTPTATPYPKVCPANPALVQVRNYIALPLTVKFSGPNTFSITIPSKGSTNICAPPGEYSTTASVTGYNNHYDTETLKTGACQCLDYYTGLFAPPSCFCPDPVSRYTRY